MPYTPAYRPLRIAILEAFSKESPRSLNRTNLIGRSSQPGGLEHHLSVVFDDDARQDAYRELQQLEVDGMVQPDHKDIIVPGDFLVLTSRGKQALASKVFDKLDETLFAIDPRLPEMRAGSWSAIASRQPDAIRQAANSAREFVDQTLKTGAPDEQVKGRPWYQPGKPDKDGKTVVTRKDRLRFLIEARHPSRSKSDVDLADKACDFVMASHQKLTAASHTRNRLDRDEIRDLLQAVEMALRAVLLSADA